LHRSPFSARIQVKQREEDKASDGKRTITGSPSDDAQLEDTVTTKTGSDDPQKKDTGRRKESKENAVPHPADTAADDADDLCHKAPELAEHYRYSDDDQPCDDGRAG
jgi:hypothetical protein